MGYADSEARSLCRVRPALGSLVAIEVEDAGAASLAAIAAAYAAVQRVEARMHPTRAGSDLVALAAARSGQSVPLDPWTWELLVLAQRIGRWSDGVFDPCLPVAPGRLEDLDLATPQLAETRRPLRLDLGGIAKGFAVDRAVEALIAGGCVAGIVNAGGDLRVFGEPRSVLLRTSRGSRWLRLHDAALAVSDPGARAPPAEHRGYQLHGVPRPDLQHPAAVIAPCAAVADALCKCVLLSPPARHGAVLERFGARAVEHEKLLIGRRTRRKRVDKTKH